MKIGIDLSFIRPDHKNGGTEAVMKNLIKGFEELKAQGLSDEFVYFIHRDIFEDYRKLFPNLTYRVYELPGPHPFRMIWFQTFCLSRILQQEKIDLLYFPTFQTGLKIHWSIPVVINPHDIQYKYYPEYFSYLKRCYFQIFYTIALKKANRVIAISRYVANSYQKYFGKYVKNKLCIIYNPIEFKDRKEEEVEALKNFDGRYILCINSLTKHKNLITLVKAFHLLLQSGTNEGLKLVIGGAKWNGTNEIADYIEQNGLQDDIILTGFLSDGQLSYLYHHAELFVTPSLYEGFGMTPVEAMAAECPVISSKETSLYEVTMGLVRYYEPADDPKALCDAMAEELKKDVRDKNRKAVLKRNKEAVLCYSKEKIVKKYLEVFHEFKETDGKK